MTGKEGAHEQKAENLKDCNGGVKSPSLHFHSATDAELNKALDSLLGNIVKAII